MVLLTYTRKILLAEYPLRT